MSPSQSPEAPADPSPRPSSPLFMEPDPIPAPSPSPAPDPQSSPSSTPSPSPSPSPSDDSPPEPSWSSGETSDPGPEPAGSGGTPSGGDPVRITRSAIQKGVSGVLDTVTRQLARVAADPVEQQYGLWRLDDGEADAIARPAARIAYRKLPEGATGNSDALDVLDLVLAVGGYVWRNLSIRSQLRAARQLGDVQAEPAPAAS